jgi:hypothetical protein
MSGVWIVPLEAAHVEMASCLRDEDSSEIMAYGMWDSAAECVEFCISRTDIGWAGICGEGIIAVGGAAASGVPGVNLGVVWLLSSRLAETHKVSFCRYTRELFGRLKGRYDALMCFTDAEYARALRWLEWLGFTTEPPEPLGSRGRLFCLAHWERS